MPRLETSRLKLSYGWLRGEDWWGDPVSANFIMIDMLLNPVIQSLTEVNPASISAPVGSMYIVGVGGVGDWLDRDAQLALRTTTGWIFALPTRGVRARLNNPAGWIWYTGTEWLDENQDDSTPVPLIGTRYDISMSVGYEPEAGETLLVFTVPEPMTLPASAAGSWGRGLGSPNGILRLQMRRNGSDIGTITFAQNSVRAIFTVQGDKPFATGDLLTIHMPDNPPAGFANYGVTLRMILPKNGG